MRRVNSIALMAILATTGLLAGCSSFSFGLSSEAEAQARLSEFVAELEQWRWVETQKVVSLTVPGSSRAVMVQDLDQEQMVATMFLVDAPNAQKLSDGSNLRYVVAPDQVLMEHPTARGACGTAWVSIADGPDGSASPVTDQLGDFGLDTLQVVEALKAATATGLNKDEQLEVTIPAEFVVAVRAFAEGLLDEAPSAELNVPATVTSENGIVTVAADTTSLYAWRLEASGVTPPPDFYARVSWASHPLTDPPEMPTPTDVADAECLG